MNETTYLDMTGTDGSQILITSHRAKFGPKTFQIRNITSFETLNNKTEIDMQNATRLAQYQRAKTAWEQQVAIQKRSKIFAAVFGVIGLLCMFSDDYNVLGIFLLMLGIASFLWNNVPEEPVRPSQYKPSWVVRIHGPGTSEKELQSLDKEKIDNIVAALEDAITNQTS